MADHAPIAYKPTDGLCYDPSEPKYWDAKGLDQEIERVFEICHGCRMCFKYCDTFPLLFAELDGPAGGDVRNVAPAKREAILDTCFQCKLCDVQCPYTPRDHHEFQLDFPKLVHRQRAIRTKARGLPVRDRVLGDPDAAGAAARASFGLANVMNRTRLHRWFMEKVLGIHRDKLLPDFAAESFDGWARKAGRLDRQAPGGEAVLFPTCYVQNNEPQIGRDTLAVLEKNQVDCRVVGGLECCGMPAWEKGDLETLRQRARHNLDRLTPYAAAGAKVVAINPTCSMMLRRDYPELVAPADRERAKVVAAQVVDPSELLWSIRNEPRFSTAFLSSPGPFAYHAPCHLRAQGIGFKGRDLIRKIPGATPTSVLECCGHDGTFAMTVEGFAASQKVGKKAFEEMKAPSAEIWTTDCPLASLQFEQHAGVRPLHPMTILARAYREDGFERKLDPEATGP